MRIPLAGLSELSLKIEKDEEYNTHRIYIVSSKFGHRFTTEIHNETAESSEWKELNALITKLYNVTELPVKVENEGKSLEV